VIPALAVSPERSLNSVGPAGGPFAPTSITYTLTNKSGTALSWTAANTQTWDTLSATSGSIPANSDTTVTVSFNTATNALAPGNYSDTVTFTSSSGTFTRSVNLTVIPALTVSPDRTLNSTGPVGGPFKPASITYTLTNLSGSALSWTAANTQTWDTLSATSGSIPANSTTTVTVSFSSAANALAAGNYTDTVTFGSTSGNKTRGVSLTVIPAMTVSPNESLNSSGPVGGPFRPASITYTLRNLSSSAVSWTAANTQTWDTLSATSGSIPANSTTTVTVSFNSAANALAAGSYSDTITFGGSGGTFTRGVSLTVIPAFTVSPNETFNTAGAFGGPFRPGTTTYTLHNSSSTSVTWTAAGTGQTWDTITPGSGTLAGGESTRVTVSINSGANTLAAGSYSDTISFSSPSGGNTTRGVSLTVVPDMTVFPTDAFSSSGNIGGPFKPTRTSYVVYNAGSTTLNWTAAKTQSWLTLSSLGGSLRPGASATVNVSINSAANSLTAASYTDTVTFTNSTNGSGNTTRGVTLAVTAP
jgi:spore coat protein U-like protein